jgi:hypothetical protein
MLIGVTVGLHGAVLWDLAAAPPSASLAVHSAGAGMEGLEVGRNAQHVPA